MDKFIVCLRVFVEVPIEAETPEEAVERAHVPLKGNISVDGKPAFWYLDVDELHEAPVFDENGNEITLEYGNEE